MHSFLKEIMCALHSDATEKDGFRANYILFMCSWSATYQLSFRKILTSEKG